MNPKEIIIFAVCLACGVAYQMPLIKFDIELISSAEAQPTSFEDYAREAARIYGVPQKELEAILHIESRREGMASQRLEQRWLPAARKIVGNETQAKMLASSHCSMQVLGITAKQYRVNWNELYKPETCAEVGVFYYAKGREICANQGKTGDRLILCAARRYNAGHGVDLSSNFGREYARKVLRLTKQ